MRKQSKLVKRILGLLTAMIMMLAMSMQVFAAGSSPVTAKVTFDASAYEGTGVLLDHEATTLPANGTEFKTLFEIPTGATHQYENQITVMDMTIQAADNAGVIDTLGYSSDIYSRPNGCYMTEFFTLGTQETGSHYDPNPGQSYWEGWSWALYVNGQKTDLYASNILVQPNDNIEWVYEWGREVW